MSNLKICKCYVALLILSVPAISCGVQPQYRGEREALYKRYLNFDSLVKGGRVDPHWMRDGSSFWYAEGSPGGTTIYKVDPTANTRKPLFDTARLRRSLGSALGHEPPGDGIPFTSFTFVEGETAIRFEIDGRMFSMGLHDYKVAKMPVTRDEDGEALSPRVVRTNALGFPTYEVPSPDGKWLAGVKNNNLYLRSQRDGSLKRITTEGIEEFGWNAEGLDPWAVWSPDSSRLVVARTDSRGVPKIPIVDWQKEQVEWFPYPKAGEPVSQNELFLVDVARRELTRIEGTDRPNYEVAVLDWRPDSSGLFLLRNERYEKSLELMVSNPASGVSRVLLSEETDTNFGGLWRKHDHLLTLLDKQENFIWLSERDGWNHLYLYDPEGHLIRRLTKGSFPVQRVVAVDEESGWVYFTAQAEEDRPYDIHLYRVDLDGGGVTRLTQGLGQHEIQFSPSKRIFLDTHSTVNEPPIVEMRRADGELLQVISKADISALKEVGWVPPEEFVVKAADGVTDLYGVLYKPADFNPSRKYPVIQPVSGVGILVPKTFLDGNKPLAQLGFVVVVVDPRGSAGRGKAFRDTNYGNIGTCEISDYVATLKQLGAERPYLDLERIGVKGYSYGGYMAVRAMLTAPDVYAVGVAAAPISDNAQHSGNELFFGPPEENREAYERASNLGLAGNLRGKLLFIHGTRDHLVPFAHTMRLVKAFHEAGIPHDLIVLPGKDHIDPDVYSGKYSNGYFIEHLKP